LGFFAVRGVESRRLTAIGERAGDLVIIEPARMVGQPFELHRYIDVGERFSRGDWTVVLYRVGCPNCEALISRWPMENRRVAEGERIAFVSVPPHSEEKLAWGVVGSSEIVWGRLTDKVDWFVRTPVVVRVASGRVREVRCSGDDEDRRATLSAGIVSEGGSNDARAT
jgi:hypothetical protein